MKTYGSGGIAPLFLTSALGGGEWPASHTRCLTPGERAPSNNWFAGWVSSIADVDAVEKRKILLLSGIESQLSSLKPFSIPAELFQLVVVMWLV
jgi:hypothetical protein